MVFAFHTMEYHGLTIHYTPVLMISPAWAIDGDRLYVALYPQVITAADALAHSSKTSILDNPRFARLHKAMGEHFSAMHFVDTAAGIEGAYPAWMMLTHYLGLADMLGIHSPPMLLAPLPAIESQLNPAMSVSWWDKVGWHERSTTPFPGAGLLAGDSTSTLSVGGMALMASVFLPSLNRNREIANRIKCASNMRQIGQAILLYSNEHNGQFPSDLGTLIIDEDISPQVFFCPSAAAVPLPANFSTMVPEAQAAWLDQHSDYIYLGRGKTSSCDPGTIILYEKDSDHGGDGMNVLYGDGHVDFETLAAAHAEINRQRQNPALSK
jgi:prepilin-type processing-associated H-X9-DG protein